MAAMLPLAKEEMVVFQVMVLLVVILDSKQHTLLRIMVDLREYKEGELLLYMKS